MDNLIIFLALFIIVYSFYYLFVVLNKKMLEKMKTGKELTFLKNNYKLDYKKINIKSLVNVVALSNSFILAFTTTLVCLLNDWIKNFYLWLLACLLMSLLLNMYACLSRLSIPTNHVSSTVLILNSHTS